MREIQGRRKIRRGWWEGSRRGKNGVKKRLLWMEALPPSASLLPSPPPAAVEGKGASEVDKAKSDSLPFLFGGGAGRRRLVFFFGG